MAHVVSCGGLGSTPSVQVAPVDLWIHIEIANHHKLFDGAGYAVIRVRLSRLPTGNRKVARLDDFH